ncbi:type 2A phosphatase-associated protein 42 [Westerdykella ornata]|uniref:Type 2A phosphatase-associated protein 42 n=1 Tax=Westerdykella ornata TaxID=318751 RepID=A0A6A6JD45_WESOR|nr:type 2A phosphatase-associated protein 42 [Westerdykella ornata]KAF2273546.1 type 2A phosphatase-associated protein 42 [Westerdykella ornata]
MPDEPQPPQSLRTLFASATQARDTLTSTPDPNSPSYQESLSTAIKTYEECLTLTSQLSLFSPNESLEDISTSDLPYLTIPYHLADLVQKLPSAGDLNARKSHLLRARDFYERFLKLLDSYDILSRDDAKLYEAYQEDRDTFTTAGGGGTRDPAKRREAKIAQFRREKELKQKLEYLRRDPKVAEEERDEQAVRELRLAELAFMVLQTFQGLESLAQELQVISLAPPPQPTQQMQAGMRGGEEEDGRGAGRRSRDAYSERLDASVPGLRYSGPILSSDGRPLRPFTLTSTRQTIQKGVFRPGHNLPTMSIDEYLEEERRRGGIIEGGGEQSGIRPEVDEDDMEKADEETMKARAWDEFKEENPKGSGNTLNRG